MAAYADGDAEWLIVVEVIDDSSYRVRYPDGSTGILVDSEGNLLVRHQL